MKNFGRELRAAERRAQRPYNFRGPMGGGLFRGKSGPPPFNGDYGALFSGYSGLTVRSYMRGDLGVTGTTGTGKSAWANQLGDGSAMGPGIANASNGIGSVGNLNGKASIVVDGATQCGLYTFPSSVAPGTVNQHLYLVHVMLAAGGGYVAASAAGPYLIKPGATGDQQIGNAAGGATSSGEALNNWHRTRCSWTGGPDVLRVGAHEPAPVNTSNNGPGTSWGFGANIAGASPTSFATVLRVHVSGPLATFLTAAAAADATLAGFWAGATPIEI